MPESKGFNEHEQPQPENEFENVFTERTRRRLGRSAALLDLVKIGGDKEDFRYTDSELIISPGQAIILMEETALGDLLPLPGEEFISANIVDFMKEGEYGTPEVKEKPDRAFLRTWREAEDSERPDKHWSQSIGTVFVYEYGGVECHMNVGLTLQAGGKLRAHRIFSMELQGRRILYKAELHDISAEHIDQTLQNFKGLLSLRANKYPGGGNTSEYAQAV